MEKIDPLVPWEPLVTRSIVHLLEETRATNSKARSLLGYAPEVHWKEALHRQIEEMKRNQFSNMKLHRPFKPLSVASKERTDTDS